MRMFKKIMVIVGVVAFILNLVPTRPVSSLTIKEEEDLARQVMGSILRQAPMVDDPDIVAYVNKIGKRILAHIPEQPFKYHFYVIDQEAYNAFATPAGHIFVYTGLLAAMEKEEELAGILGHEIAHVTCRHISQKIERSKKLQVATFRWFGQTRPQPSPAAASPWGFVVVSGTGGLPKAAPAGPTIAKNLRAKSVFAIPLRVGC